MFLRIVKGRKFISTYALLDSGSESTSIRAEFLKRLYLDVRTKLANISNIKDTGETIRVKEVKPQIVDHGNNIILHIDGALLIEKEKLNMPSQHLPLGFHLDEKWTYIQNLKLDDINPNLRGWVVVLPPLLVFS